MVLNPFQINAPVKNANPKIIVLHVQTIVKHVQVNQIFVLLAMLEKHYKRINVYVTKNVKHALKQQITALNATNKITD